MGQNIFRGKYAPVVWMSIVAITISFLTRVALLISFRHSIDASLASLICSFPLGLLFDMIVAGFLIIPFVLQITFTNNFVYTKQGKWITIGVFILLLCVLFFTNIIPKDFNKDLYKGLVWYIVLRFVIFLFLLQCTPAFRTKWRTAILKVFYFLFVFVLLFNAVSEWFFWNEFSSRYNFIAVDYLVYTNEVLGNIKESYPVGWLIFIVLVVTAGVYFITRKYIQGSVIMPLSFPRRLLMAGLFLLVPLLAALCINPQIKNFSKNNYANELAGNGLYEFVQAFQNNELDFYKYYKTISDAKAFAIMRQQLSSPNAIFTGTDSFSIERAITYNDAEIKKNVVLISVESLSASFLGTFGNTQQLTPFLDSLAHNGMLFTNMYASGTRTVRGLEALALSIPPTPGQSLVKKICFRLAVYLKAKDTLLNIFMVVMVTSII